MGKYFGTDGFRGEANVALTAARAYKVGRFLGWYYGRNHEDGRARIVIGKDTRRSSYMLVQRCGRLSPPRDDHAICGILHADRRIRLRHHDQRLP